MRSGACPLCPPVTASAVWKCVSFLFSVWLEASLRVSEGVFHLGTVCVSRPPLAVSSGPRHPQETAVSFFTVTSRGPRRVAPGLQTNSVWLESLRFVFVSALPATTDHASCRSRGREMASAVTPSVWTRDQTPTPLNTRLSFKL